MKVLKTIHRNWESLFLNNKSLLEEILTTINPLTISPEKSKVFNCFKTDPFNCKLVIVGDNPYPLSNYATGYCFDVPKNKYRAALSEIIEAGGNYGIKINSLDNIKEDVLLLCVDLTTTIGKFNTHDWAPFTKLVVEYVKENNPSCGFIFLGQYAQKINTDIINGINYYDPSVNFFRKEKLFNKSFFEKTQKYINWKQYYDQTT